MKMALISVLTLLTLSMTGCSQTKSQSNQGSEADAPVVISDNSPLAMGTKPTETDLVKEWNGKVGENYFRWDGKDLRLKPKSGVEVGIFSKFAESDYGELKRTEDTKGCSTNYYYRPLAIAGDLISFEYESGILCGATNSVDWGYTTFELARDRRFLFYRPNSKAPAPTKDPTGIALTDIFEEEDVFSALMTNQRISSDIARLVGQGKVNKAPESLPELSKIVERFQDDFLGGEFYWNFDQFAIHDVENGKADVWISLLPQLPPARALHEHLEISLPIPPKAERALSLADSQNEGFLMKDASKIVGTGYAKFEFGGKN